MNASSVLSREYTAETSRLPNPKPAREEWRPTSPIAERLIANQTP